mmetsp:Transcript_29166/g.60717  ORF Transcript_29166/g.60717 Transcript_29166/m.60717 type:complete len:80 (+) Transcript_29166:310-549(+)
MAAVLEGRDSLAKSEQANSDNGNHVNDNHDNNKTIKNKNNHIVPDNREVMLELALYAASGGILPTLGGVTAAAAKIAAF